MQAAKKFLAATWLFPIATVFLLALFLPAIVSAQGCSLCYGQAAASGARMIQALRSGILVLIFPPMAICIGITVLAYRKRNQFRSNESDSR